MARRKAHVPDFAGTAWSFHTGRPGSAGSDASKTDASASFDAPSRYLSAFAFLGRRTDAGPSVPRMVLSRRPLGGVAVSATPASTASRPTFMTPHESAP